MDWGAVRVLAVQRAGARLLRLARLPHPALYRLSQPGPQPGTAARLGASPV